jgi:hypothetical protein
MFEHFHLCFRKWVSPPLAGSFLTFTVTTCHDIWAMNQPMLQISPCSTFSYPTVLISHLPDHQALTLACFLPLSSILFSCPQSNVVVVDDGFNLGKERHTSQHGYTSVRRCGSEILLSRHHQCQDFFKILVLCISTWDARLMYGVGPLELRS